MMQTALPGKWIVKTTWDGTSLFDVGGGYHFQSENLKDALRGKGTMGNDQREFFTIEGALKLSRQKNLKGLLLKIARIEYADLNLFAPQRVLWASIVFSSANQYWAVMDANRRPFLYILDTNLGWKISLVDVPFTVATGLHIQIESDRTSTDLTIHREAGALHPAYQPVLLPVAIFCCHVFGISVMLD